MRKLLFLFMMLTMTASIMWANEKTPMPEISYYDTGESVVVTATGYGHICLYWDDMFMADGEYEAYWEIPYGEDPEGEEFGIAATAQEEGKEISDYALATVYVPGKPIEVTPMPEISYYDTGESVVVTATGYGHICLYWDDMLMAEGEGEAYWEIPYGEDPEGEEFGIAATAQEEGKEISDYALATIYVPGMQHYQTPVPEIYSDVTDEAVIITAVGEGIVTIYIQYIDNETGNMTTETYVGDGMVEVYIPRGVEDMYINYWASAQASDDALPGFTDVEYYFLVPGISEPVPHDYSKWVIFIDRNGDEHWYQLYQGWNLDYSTTVSLDYATFGGYRPGIDPVRQVPLYFMIDGVKYGAADNKTEVVLGDAMANPLNESDGYYTLPVGYGYSIGFMISYDNWSGEIDGYYVYAVQGTIVNGDPSEYADETLRGDADGDGTVSIADIVVIVDYMLNSNSTEINLAGAEADLDGHISIADIVAIVDYMLAKTW